jgi:hypothetical protein
VGGRGVKATRSKKPYVAVYVANELFNASPHCAQENESAAARVAITRLLRLSLLLLAAALVNGAWPTLAPRTRQPSGVP